MEFLDVIIFGNTIQDYWIAGGVFLLLLLFICLGLPFCFRKLEALAAKTKTEFDDVMLQVLTRIPRIFFVSLALLFTVKFFLHLGNEMNGLVNGLLLILIVFELIRMIQAVIFYLLTSSDFGRDKTSLQGVKLISKIILWAVAVLVVLSNLGFDITALAASLGIGGIAIALAVQNILGDLFASFTIYFDKPFAVGDYVVLDSTQSGVVEKIGLKTTRIKTLQGEELVVSNKQLTESQVRNFKQLKRRRVVFQFGVTYDTPAKKLKKIPELIEKIIEKLELAEILRVHFMNFGDSSLDFEIVYFVNDSDYTQYMDIQQTINLEIVEAFEKEKIEMAFPTRTVYLKKEV